MTTGTLSLQHPDKLYIGGEWVEPSTQRRFDIIHPATGLCVMQVPEAREADADRAITVAREAFDRGAWPTMPAEERYACLLKWADAIEQRTGDLTLAHTIEIGNPVSASSRTAGVLAETLRGIVAMARTYAFVEERPAWGGTAHVTREPVGVVLAIVPWNLPGHLGLIKMAPALAAGCTIVVKPSPEAPLDMLIMAECAEAAGFPAGVLSVITADRDIGDRMVRDRRIDKVSFTGSTAAGKHIGSVCMERVARVSLELGGKSAAIVLDDMEPAEVVPALVPMSTLLTGQACMALTRVLVPASRAVEYEQALGNAYEQIVVGDPFDPATQMGPLATERQLERVERYIEKGKAEGARLVAGGRRLASQNAGYFIEPTVFADVTNDMTIAQEEIFGPVLCIISYCDDEEAIEIANDSPYGLSGAIFTKDACRFRRIARQIRTGSVAQNAMGPQGNLPFGGFKQSGVGREGGAEAFDLYTEIKTIYSTAL